MVQPKKSGLHEDTKEDAKSSISTPYIVKGDGQITIKVVSPAKRDRFLASHHVLQPGKATMSAQDDDETPSSESKKDTGHTDKGNDEKSRLPILVMQQPGTFKLSTWLHIWNNRISLP